MSERRLSNVRDCFNCPNKKRGCRSGCVDMAIREVLDAISLSERKELSQLHADLHALKRRDIIRNAKKDAHLRNR